MKKGKSKKRSGQKPARPEGQAPEKLASPAEALPEEARPAEPLPEKVPPEKPSLTELPPEAASPPETSEEALPEGASSEKPAEQERLPEPSEPEPAVQEEEAAPPPEAKEEHEEGAGSEPAGLRRIWSEELGGARQRAGRLWGRVRNKNYVRPQKGQVRLLFRRRFTYQELVGVFLALCPLVGVTSSAADGLAAGLLSTLTLLGSVFIIEIFRRVLPDGIGSLGHMILVAGFTTGLTLALRALMPLLVEDLGIYLSMTVVSCLALERQVSSSQKQGSLFLLMDSAITGLSFTLILTGVSLLREFLGSGAVFGVPVLGGAAPLAIMSGPFGGFFCLGCVAALAQGLQPRRKPAAERRRRA